MEDTKEPDPKAFDRFRNLVKRVVGVPKSEIDKRSKAWKEERAATKAEASKNKAPPHLSRRK